MVFVVNPQSVNFDSVYESIIGTTKNWEMLYRKPSKYWNSIEVNTVMFDHYYYYSQTVAHLYLPRTVTK